MSDGPAPATADESGNLALVAAMTRDFAQSRDAGATLAFGLGEIAQALAAEAASVFLLSDDGRDLVCETCWGPVDVRGLTVRPGQGIVGRAVSECRTQLVRAVDEDPDFYTGADSSTGFVTRSVLCAPMLVGSTPLGAIEVLNKRSGAPFDERDRALLASLASAAALALHNARLTEEIVTHERLRRERDLAADIQRTLLPARPPADVPVYGLNVPADDVSGDFFDIVRRQDGRIWFNVGDVSGKGLDAAILMAKTASLFSCLAKTMSEPDWLLATLDAELAGRQRYGMFVTMLAGLYDPRTGLAEILNAGHEPALVVDGDGNLLDTIPATAPPLGLSRSVSSGAAFDSQALVTLPLAPHTLYVFTDGLTEARDARGVPLGPEGVHGLLATHRDLPAPDRLARVVERVRAEGHTIRDDLTILAVETDSSAYSTAPARTTADQHSELPNDPDLAARAQSLTETGAYLLALTVPARADRLRLIRGELEALCRYLKAPGSWANDVTLAVDEACQNVVRHAYGGSGEGDLALVLTQGAGVLLVQVFDDGAPVDTTRIGGRRLDDLAPGGLGTHFIAAVMDHVAYHRWDGAAARPRGTGRANTCGPSRNELRMVKRLQDSSEAS